tara:strand:- start:1547 stop:2743 length:1197 start_codon:yes stop_codon:yes gene_type:complete
MKTKITNIGSIATWCPIQNQFTIIRDVDLLLDEYTIIEIGPNILNADREIDAFGALITPGFVDSHTHPIFSGDRSNEFSMRVDGKTYEEISQSGGGIISSIDNVRKSKETILFDESLIRTNFFLQHGTTTIEAKSGYGLTIEDEIKSLRVIQRLQQESALDFVPTFMGAHAFPPEFINDQDAYIDIICNDMIPEISKEKLAEYCDVFCESGYFSVEQSRKILESAKKHGMKIRLHADEFKDSGAAELAAELDAVTADHLMAVSENGIRSMAQKGVIATLLPGTTLFLGKSDYANGRKIIDMGCDVALATDYNPGSSTIQSMPFILSLACLYCGLSIEEAFIGSTWNGARALHRENILGAISIGYQADLIFWDINTINEIPYWMGSDRIRQVMKNGVLI